MTDASRGKSMKEMEDRERQKVMKTFFSSKGFHRQVLINNPSIKLFQNLFPTQSCIEFIYVHKKIFL